MDYQNPRRRVVSIRVTIEGREHWASADITTSMIGGHFELELGDEGILFCPPCQGIEDREYNRIASAILSEAAAR